MSAARTGLEDSLGSVGHVAPSEFDVRYVRRDLSDSSESLDRAKSRLVDAEIVGVAEASLRRATGTAESDLGPYGVTLRSTTTAPSSASSTATGGYC